MKNFKNNLVSRTCSTCKHMIKTFKIENDCSGECLIWTLADAGSYNIKNIYTSCCDDYEERNI
jgi:hypothetical protein